MNIYVLINKVLANQATAAENSELQTWLAESEQNREEFEDLKLLWDADATSTTESTSEMQVGLNKLMSSLKKKTSDKKRKKNLLLWSYFIVAALMMMSALFYKFYIPNQKSFDVISFDHAPLSQVISYVYKNYNVKIVTANEEILNCTFSAVFYQQPTKDEFMQSLTHALNLEIKMLAPDHYILTGKPCANTLHK